MKKRDENASQKHGRQCPTITETMPLFLLRSELDETAGVTGVGETRWDVEENQRRSDIIRQDSFVNSWAEILVPSQHTTVLGRKKENG